MCWVSEDLHARGVRRLMVEGGGKVLTQFLTAGLADELHLVVAPFFVGDSRARRFVGDGSFPWNPDRRAELAEVRRIGDVVLLRYALSDRFDRGPKESTMHLPAATIRTQVMLPLRFADGFGTTARVYTFDGLADGREHLALGLGDRAAAVSADPEARRWSGSTASASPATSSAASGATAGRSCPRRSGASRRSGGFLLYLRQEGRGIGLYAKLDAYALQDAGLDTYDANLALGYREDGRDYTVAAQMLRCPGPEPGRPAEQQPGQGAQLDRLGVTVAERVPTAVHLNASNARYLATKARRGAHTIDLPCAGRARARLSRRMAESPTVRPVISDAPADPRADGDEKLAGGRLGSASPVRTPEPRRPARAAARRPAPASR